MGSIAESDGQFKGQQSKAQVSTHLEVVSVTGLNGSDTNIENLSIVVKLSPGSESMEFDEIIVNIDTMSRFETLMYESNHSDYDSNEYIVTYLENGTSHLDGYLVRGDVALIDLQLPAGETLEEDEDVRIDFIPKVGVQTSMEITMPDIMTTYRVHLFP